MNQIINVDKMLAMLSSTNSISDQNTGINEALKVSYLSIFFQPIEDITLWENCAKVIVSKDDFTLQRYLPQMFEWLQDMAWPGAWLIFDRLKSMQFSDIESAYNDCYERAVMTEDLPWKQALEYLHKK